jgi:hypothetical protein
MPSAWTLLPLAPGRPSSPMPHPVRRRGPPVDAQRHALNNHCLIAHRQGCATSSIWSRLPLAAGESSTPLPRPMRWRAAPAGAPRRARKTQLSSARLNETLRAYPSSCISAAQRGLHHPPLQIPAIRSAAPAGVPRRDLGKSPPLLKIG